MDEFNENDQNIGQSSGQQGSPSLPSELERLEEDVIRKLEEKVELKKMEEEARTELTAAGTHGAMEQLLLMLGAGIMIIILPFVRYFLGAFLTLFAVLISFIAGLTSPKKPYSAVLNLLAAAAGTLFFEYGAIFEHHEYGLTLLFWVYQALALIFLFASYFSMSTYRRKVLEE